MEDLLLDDDEKASINRRRRWFTIIGCLAILAFFAIGLFIDHYKPLPSHDYCTEKGFEAGEEKLGTIMCYKECSTNELSSCQKVMAVRK